MIEKIACSKCGALILPATSKKTDGLCMPCKQGIRQSIEASKRYYEELKKYDPYRELWKSLVERVHKTQSGFSGLNKDEQLYYSVHILQREVFNGGFDQFFWNSSGDLFSNVIAGLETLGAFKTLALVREAKRIVFSDADAPINWEDRRTLLRTLESQQKSEALHVIDKAFWEEPENMNDKLKDYAERQGLVTPFLKEEGLPNQAL